MQPISKEELKTKARRSRARSAVVETTARSRAMLHEEANKTDEGNSVHLSVTMYGLSTGFGLG